MMRAMNRRDARLVSEAEFQRAVLEYAEWNGWRAVHFRPARIKNGEWRTPIQGKHAKGFFDTVLVRPPRVVFLELKREDGKMSPEQVEWLAALRQCGGVEVAVVRPSGWGVVEKMLGRGRRIA